MMEASMEDNMQVEQQNEEIAESIFEWKVDRFLEIDTDIRNSPFFKFGSHEACLNLEYAFFQFYFEDDVRQFRYLKIELLIDEGLSTNAFSQSTYFKGGLISLNGDLLLSTEGYVRPRTYCFPVISRDESCILAVLENMAELAPKNILTFRLVWSNNITRLDSMITRKTSPDRMKDEIPRKSLEKLSNDLKASFENRTNTDCVLMVDKKQFRVHRAVLSARSPVFAAMFQHDTLENSGGVVNIPDVDAGIMNEVLYYVYTGQIRRLDPETAAPMYIAADKYQLLEMKDDCLQFLMETLTFENFMDAIELADVYQVSALEKKVIEFIAENAEELHQNNAWEEYSIKNPSLGFKYLKSALVIKLNSKT